MLRQPCRRQLLAQAASCAVFALSAQVCAEHALTNVPGLSLTSGDIYAARQQVYLNNTEQLPAFTTLDARLRYVMQAAGATMNWRLRLPASPTSATRSSPTTWAARTR